MFPNKLARLSSSTAATAATCAFTQKRFKDQVYGHIELPALCVAFIDTPQFQRLRLLKQLGAGYFVFPGASHNRFEHSIGVAWLAGVLMRRIQERQPELEITREEVELVQLTGLLHDLGHGPFSHLFDHNFLQQHHANGERRPLTHEDMTLRVLDYLLEDNKLDLKEQFGLDHEYSIQFIRASLLTEHRAGFHARCPFMLDVVHNARNGLDVDRLDYFQRDAMNTGMKSLCEVDRLFSEMRVLGGSGDEMCFPEKLAEDVLAAYKTRFTLFRAVYAHKVVKSIEFMIVDALLLADDANGQVFPWKLAECASNVQDYCETNDDVLQQIKRSKSKHASAVAARELVRRLETRDLYSCVAEISLLHHKDDDDGSSSSMALWSKSDKEWEDMLCGGGGEGGLSRKAFRVDLVDLNYGKHDKNPLDSVGFYSKAKPDTIRRLQGSTAIACPPSAFQRRFVRIFTTASKTGEDTAATRWALCVAVQRIVREHGHQGGVKLMDGSSSNDADKEDEA